MKLTQKRHRIAALNIGCLVAVGLGFIASVANPINASATAKAAKKPRTTQRTSHQNTKPSSTKPSSTKPAPPADSLALTAPTKTTSAAPSASSPIVIGVVGDVACKPTDERTDSQCRDREVAQLISGDSDIENLLLAGDLQYDDGNSASFAAGFDKTFGRFRAMSIPVPGNHEYGTSGAAGYFGYFGSLAHPESDGYYSKDLGDSWHVVLLNSNCEFVSCSPTSAQMQWLKADLAANKRPCLAAMWHHPRFSSASHGNDARSEGFWEVLQNAHADVIFTGHDHGFERFNPQGPTGKSDASGPIEFVVGTGGKSRYAFDSSLRPNSAAHVYGYGFLRVELASNGFSWRFVPESLTTSGTDSGTATCKAK
jgi:acid phosphatase type 7